ncbi:MAG TPA: beta-propeller fold lactonase family protein [Thermoleophilaceae bacterium]
MLRLAPRLSPLLLLLIFVVAPASASAAPPPFGGLTQVPGCISATGSGGACSVGRVFSADGYPETALSPDGRNLYASSSNLNAFDVLAVDPGTGAITQLAGAAGCFSADGSGGECTGGNGLAAPEGAAVSPDGKNVYMTQADDTVGGIAAFSRDAASGALTQLGGGAACINQNGSGGCMPGSGLAGARSVAVSPDGLNVYVASRTDNAVAALSRDPATGALTQLAGTAACITSGAATGCGPGKALGGAWSVAVSPDGKNVYVMADNDGTVAAFSRDAASGALTQLAGTDGCVSASGNGGMCATYAPLSRPRSAAFSPDGADVYFATLTSGALVGFSRGASGALTPLTGTTGCVSKDGSGGACAAGTTSLANANGVAVSPDGRTIYVVSIDPTNAVSEFARDTTSGAITQLPGGAGCVSEDGSAGACVDGVALRLSTWPTITADGAHVLVSGLGDNNIATFSRELPPVCTSFARTVMPDTPTQVSLPCNDPNGDPLTRTLTVTQAHGVFGPIDQAGGSVLFTPSLGASSLTFSASDGTLSSQAADGSITASDTVAPVISRASISPHEFAVARAHGAKVKRGAVISYRVTEVATVTFTVQRRAKGRRAGKKCRAPSRKNRHGKRCTRFVKVRGQLTQSAVPGLNHEPFSGRLRRRALKPRAYRLVLQATDPTHNRSKVRRLAFKIVPAA